MHGSKIESVFEIGCAYGYFLDLVRKEYRQVFGVDISEDAVGWAREKLKIKAVSGDYLEMKVPSYDLCCLWDTIEHLKRPDLVIQKISMEINDHGYLALTTGDLGSLNAKLRGRKWRQIHPPTHLHYFSRETIVKLLNNHRFKIIHISHQGYYLPVR